MKNLLFIIFILSLCRITPSFGSTPAPTPSDKDAMKLTISVEELRKDKSDNIISVKVKAVLKNVSGRKVSMTVSECSPDHFYEASVNGGDYFLPIVIMHIRYCGMQKTFKPGEGFTTVIEVKTNVPVKMIRFRYPLEKDHIYSNELKF